MSLRVAKISNLVEQIAFLVCDFANKLMMLMCKLLNFLDTSNAKNRRKNDHREGET